MMNMNLVISLENAKNWRSSLFSTVVIVIVVYLKIQVRGYFISTCAACNSLKGEVSTTFKWNPQTSLEDIYLFYKEVCVYTHWQTPLYIYIVACLWVAHIPMLPWVTQMWFKHTNERVYVLRAIIDDPWISWPVWLIRRQTNDNNRIPT